MHIEMGDDERYNIIGIGTVTFQRQSGKTFILKYVMYVPCLKNNLVSVVMLCNQLQKQKKRDINALEMSHFEGETSNTLHK